MTVYGVLPLDFLDVSTSPTSVPARTSWKGMWETDDWGTGMLASVSVVRVWEGMIAYMEDRNDIHKTEWHSLNQIINTNISKCSIYS